MSLHVGVFGHYGNGNLGDEAITEACVDSARRLLGADRVTLFSIVPGDSAARHNLDAYPIRRSAKPASAGTPWHRPAPAATATAVSAQPPPEGGIKGLLKRSKLLRAGVNLARSAVSAPGRFAAERQFLAASEKVLADVDLIIVAGSNQYLDNFGGTWGFPYTLMKWANLCKKTNTSLVFLSIGAGPIDKPLSRFMVRKAIKQSLFHSYRDPGSLRLIEGQEARLGGVVYPDLACNLQFAAEAIDYETDALRIAINPMPVYGDYWFTTDKVKYEAYLTKLAKLAIHTHGRGCEVILFPTQTRDLDAANDLVEITRRHSPIVADALQVIDTNSSQDVMRVIQSAHVIVPTRFHGTILGILAKRLVLSVCYQAKAREAMVAAGQSDYALMLDEMTADQLCAAYDKLIDARAVELAKVSARSEEVRTSIDAQYDIVRERLPAR
ncbi:MAG: polysaccharide pyruvyl transferase family protein [Gammaproteobacteria bacterium]